MRVLVAEDQAKLAMIVATGLRRAGMAVDVVFDGTDALEHTASTEYDVVVLDRDLPGVHGDEVCRKLVAGASSARILMLTGARTVGDRIEGLGLGADDYLPKPFELSILIARLEGLLRRSLWMKQSLAISSRPESAGVPEEPTPQKDVFNFAAKSVDFSELELRSLGNTIHLTVMEAELFRYLVKSAGRVVSRKALLEDVWGLHEDTDTRAIDNFIVRLRRYIEEDPSRPKHLQTVRGVGYKFVAEP